MRKYTVAIADDNSTDLFILKRELELNGKFAVSCYAFNGLELIKFLSQTSEIIDILIIDLHMPILNGLETIRILKSSGYKGKILGVTYGFYENTIRQLKSMGIAGCCNKKPKKVVMVAELLINDKIYFDELYYLDWEKRSKTKDLYKLDEDQLLNSLSSIERRIIKNLAKGLSSKQIGPLLGLGGSTINQYKSRILQKLNLKNDNQLVAYAFVKGIFTTNDFYDLVL